MTGFGKATRTLDNKKITTEIRSLNSKQLDLGIKMPGKYRTLEYEIRALAAKGIVRGKAEISISVETTAVESTASVNKEMFAAYYRQIREAQQAAGITDSGDITSIVMRMPDVVSQEVATISEEEHTAIMECVEEAIAEFDAFRVQEGAVLIADLLARVDLIESYKVAVEPYEASRIETIRTRINDNLAKLAATPDNNRFEQELIFYLEKLDITEEKVRLTNHCNYFRTTAGEEEQVGRKLGFIAQEMGREINTMGSKANNAEIQILVVKMKDELEKIKEQVLNIL
ncbi:MAG: YicC family protein [Rikenellaceae bacterium]|nr:YicC family protein [Rikenellaceae bacterium]